MIAKVDSACKVCHPCSNMFFPEALFKQLQLKDKKIIFTFDKNLNLLINCMYAMAIKPYGNWHVPLSHPKEIL